jgi:hypothetical protein
MITRTNIKVVEIVGRWGKSLRPGRRITLGASVLSACLLMWANGAQAQIAVAPVAVSGWGGGQTAEGAYLQGAATVIQAEGMYNVNTAQAMVEYEQARGLYLSNRKKATENYYAGKEMHQAIEAQKRERNKTSTESLTLAAKSSVPATLEAAEFNPETGKIAWPKVLLDSQFSAKRAEIEKLAATRVKTTGKPETVKKIQAATVEMSSILKSKITKLPANDYMHARKFLDSLAVTVSQG